MSLKAVLVLVAAVLVIAPARPAFGAMGPGGCPAGYVAFDRQTGDGQAPSYRQGETVVASGVIANTDAGVAEATLRWGAPEGPEIGRAAVDASGSWKGITFEIPQDVVDGDQQVFYVARDRSGQMLPGLPYPFTINVGEPVAPASREAAPATASPAVARRPATNVPRPERSAAKTVAPATVDTARGPAPARSAAAPAARAPAAVQPPVRARTAPTNRPSRQQRGRPAVRSARDLRASSQTDRAVEKPDSGTQLTRNARSATADVAPPPRALVTAVVGTGADRDGASGGRDAPLMLAAIGGLVLALVGLGAYGAGMRVGRRRGSDDDGAAVRLATPDDACPIEDELQAMLAEREADTGARDRQDIAPLR